MPTNCGGIEGIAVVPQGQITASERTVARPLTSPALAVNRRAATNLVWPLDTSTVKAEHVILAIKKIQGGKVSVIKSPGGIRRGAPVKSAGPVLVPAGVDAISRLPRDEMLEVADSTLRKRLITALQESQTDWRTVSSLADELDVSVAQVRHELSILEPETVRRPRGQESKYPDWYRLTSRGLTRPEKLLRLKAIVTFAIVDDDF